MPEIELRRASLADRPVLKNLLQFYFHDMTEHWFDRPYGEVDEQGRFPAYIPLDVYWEDAGHIPLFLRQAGHLVGFALLDQKSHAGGEALDRNMAEFFVLRKHRRSGAGTAAVHAIFSTYPGRWEAAVMRRNTGALAFWRKAVASHVAVANIQEHDTCNDLWDGPVLRFRIRAGEG